MKVALVHDWLIHMRGGEKVLEGMAEVFPDATIYTLFYDRRKLSPSLQRMEIKSSFLQSIPGIQRVAIVGEHKYAMRLRFDPVKLAAYQLTPEDIRIALQRENIDLPYGRIEGNSNELSVRTLGRLTTPVTT